ncbi:MAG: acyl carrier protein [Myxococcota bacterium]
MSEAVSERIHKVVCDQLGVERSELRPDAILLDDLGADSLDVVEMVMALEDAFDLEIPDEDVEGIRTLGDVEGYLSKRLAG